MVVFDTSLIVDASRNRKYALDLIMSYSGNEQIATTIITKYEMLRGVPEQYIDLVSDLLKIFVILDFGDDSLNETVKVYQNLRKKGRLVSELDVIIAGIAAANNETLITKDKGFLNLESNKIIVLSHP